MKTIRHPTPATFLSVAGEFLAANEALNNIFFGIAGDAVLDRYAGADNLWLSAHDEDAVVGAALQTPPYELAIAHGSSPEAVLALARAAQTQRGDALDRQWRRFCRRLSRAGTCRADWQGPLDFADQAAGRHPSRADDIRWIGARYAELRYGRNPPTRRDLADLETRIRHLDIP